MLSDQDLIKAVLADAYAQMDLAKAQEREKQQKLDELMMQETRVK